MVAVLAFAGCSDESGTATTFDGGASCRAATAALQSSCAAGLAEVWDCWRPEGDCEVQGLGVNFENGSRFETVGLSALDEGRYLGPNGEVCGTFSANDSDPSDGTTSVDFTNPDGEMYTVESEVNLSGSSVEVGDITIRCPSGQSVVLSAENQEELQACSAPLELCRNTADFDPNDIDPDTFGECNTDAECSQDVPGVTLVCCDFSGQGLCQPRETCEAIGGFGACEHGACSRLFTLFTPVPAAALGGFAPVDQPEAEHDQAPDSRRPPRAGRGAPRHGHLPRPGGSRLTRATAQRQVAAHPHRAS